MFIYGFLEKKYVFACLLEPTDIGTNVKLSFAKIKERYKGDWCVRKNEQSYTENPFQALYLVYGKNILL